MPTISIQGTIIEFPDSAQSPNWAEPVIQFAQAVAAALSSVAGPFDISPQIYVMVSNANTNVPLPSLSFPPSNVQGAVIDYTVYRTNGTSTAVSEVGTLYIVYNPYGATNSKWEISREHTGDASVSFIVTDTGQIQFSSDLIAGYNQGTIGYVAKALLIS